MLAWTEAKTERTGVDICYGMGSIVRWVRRHDPNGLNYTTLR